MKEIILESFMAYTILKYPEHLLTIYKGKESQHSIRFDSILM